MPRQTFLKFFEIFFTMAGGLPFVVVKYGQNDPRWLRLEYGLLPGYLDLHFTAPHLLNIKSAIPVVMCEINVSQAEPRISVEGDEAQLDVSNFRYFNDIGNLTEVHSLIVGRNVNEWHERLSTDQPAAQFDDLTQWLHTEALKLLPDDYILRAWSSLPLHH